MSYTNIILYYNSADINICLKIASKPKPKHVRKYNQYMKNVVTGRCFSCNYVTMVEEQDLLQADQSAISKYL
jgi:hypothetical protein